MLLDREIRMHNPESILAFWFGTEADDGKVAQQKGRMWWAKNEATDREIATRFAEDLAAAASGQRDTWAATPSSLLAFILLTDQFPRNIHRGQAASFAYDELALRWSLDGLARGMDRKLRPIQRVFFYLPLEHAESIVHQKRSVQLFEQLWREAPEPLKETFAGFLNFAVRHRDIVERFGRFPHRNAILGRTSTQEEIAFLQTPGSGF